MPSIRTRSHSLRVHSFVAAAGLVLFGCDDEPLAVEAMGDGACEAADCAEDPAGDGALSDEGSESTAVFPKWEPGHYVFVGIDPGPLKEKHIKDGFRGVQKAYLWNKIE